MAGWVRYSAALRSLMPPLGTNRTPVKGAADLGPGRTIAIEFADGTVDAVTGSGGGTPRRKPAKGEAEKPALRQGSLF